MFVHYLVVVIYVDTLMFGCAVHVTGARLCKCAPLFKRPSRFHGDDRRQQNPGEREEPHRINLKLYNKTQKYTLKDLDHTCIFS